MTDLVSCSWWICGIQTWQRLRDRLSTTSSLRDAETEREMEIESDGWMEKDTDGRRDEERYR